VVHYWGTPQKKPSLPKQVKIQLDHALRRERYVDCVAQDEESLARSVQAIRTFMPNVIVSYARAGGNLARYINQTGARDWDDIPFICTAEQLLPHDREEIERAFGRHVYDSYGGRETMLLAMECAAHEGLHTTPENILLEIEVTEPCGRRRPARPGETGEVVVTDLHNFGAPLIRYLNGDLAKAMDDRACRCGRSLPRIAAVEGRKADTLIDGFGGRVHGMLFPVLMLPLASMVKQYQAVQHADRSVTIRIVPFPRFDEETRRFILDRVSQAVRGVPIHLKLVDSIRVSPSGKRHPVIVET
jgi:phenylacetate-CoA ligase